MVAAPEASLTIRLDGQHDCPMHQATRELYVWRRFVGYVSPTKYQQRALTKREQPLRRSLLAVMSITRA